MLVLSRKRDQSIIVGEEIKITVVDVRGDTVQLGIDAPRAIGIYREEIYAAIRAANEEAAERRNPEDDEGQGPVTPPSNAGGAQ